MQGGRIAQGRLPIRGPTLEWVAVPFKYLLHQILQGFLIYFSPLSCQIFIIGSIVILLAVVLCSTVQTMWHS